MLPLLLAALASPAVIAEPVELDTIRPSDAVPLNGRYLRAIPTRPALTTSRRRW